MHENCKNFIGTLQVRGAGRDDPALRLAVSSQLGCAEFRPPGMPPSVVLIVRSMADPLPGRLSIRGGPTRLCSAWERAVQDRLGELYRRAARPQQGMLAGDADAVVFTDEAELLACLAMDLASGLALHRWWWRLILKSLPFARDASACIRQLLVETPRYIPAVMGLLASWRRAEPFLNSLEAADALVALTAMLREYDLTEFAVQLSHDERTSIPKRCEADIDASGSRDTDASESELLSTDAQRPIAYKYKGDATPVDKTKDAASVDKTMGHGGFVSKESLLSHWHRWLDYNAVPHGLGREQSGLFGLGLTLCKMPWLARREDFQQSVLKWWHAPERVVRSSVPVTTKPTVSQPGGKVDTNDQEPEHTAHNKMTPCLMGKAKSESASREADQFKSTVTSEVSLKGHDKNHTDNQLNNVIEFSPPLREQIDEPETITTMPDATAPIEAGEEQQAGLALPDDFAGTRLGGVLYLINLMDQLDLLDCFESDWRLATQLSRWALLELLVGALLDEQMATYRHDPLWRVLAELDGRSPHDPIGSNFIGHDTFRLPVSWFEYLCSEQETFCWATHRKRLRLWSASGYVLAEVPRNSISANDQAKAELRNYLADKSNHLLSLGRYAKAPLACRARYKKQGVSNDLALWLGLVIPAIRRHLCMSLGLRSATGRTLVKYLFGCSGRLYVTSSHIDFVTDINNISIRLRKAGLDRDPGWLPEFGRVVQFHFE